MDRYDIIRSVSLFFSLWFGLVILFKAYYKQKIPALAFVVFAAFATTLYTFWALE